MRIGRSILALCALVGAYVVYVALFREARYHGVGLNALPANATRAATAG